MEHAIRNKDACADKRPAPLRVLFGPLRPALRWFEGVQPTPGFRATPIMIILQTVKPLVNSTRKRPFIIKELLGNLVEVYRLELRHKTNLAMAWAES